MNWLGLWFLVGFVASFVIVWTIDFVLPRGVADWLAFTTTITAAAGVLVVTIAWVASEVDEATARRRCNSYHEVTGRSIQVIHTGPNDWRCFAEVDGQWYESSQIRVEDRR